MQSGRRLTQSAGKFLKIAGITAFAGVFFPNLAVWFILVPVLVVAFYTVDYSYLAFREEKENSEGAD
jgi:uncharacterized membrane protein